MKRDWRDFKALHGNLPGARDAFEKACETLFRKIHNTTNVQQVEIKQGDGGIDIFIGEIGVSPITVIQCKFFLEEFGEAQQNQIRESFNKAKESTNYALKEWILCIPIVLDLNQNKWWCNWKNKKEIQHCLNSDFIKLVNGNELIDLLVVNNLYNQIFQIEDSLLNADTNEKVNEVLQLLKKQDEPNQNNNKTEKNISDILFNNYSLENEAYYLERICDNHFIKNIRIGNIWIYGKSGVGKTALVYRNLLKNNIDYIFCDLSPIDIDSIDDIFEEIILNIIEKYKKSKLDQLNKIKHISCLLNSCNINNDIIIVIDELSLSSLQLQKEFADSIIRLVSYYNRNNNNNYLKFVISTISEPLTIIENKAKASEHFTYLSINDWEDALSDLLKLLCYGLELHLSEKSFALIVAESRSNARLLKNILRKIVLIDNKSDINIELAIKEAIKEYF